jgi:hypothetical protein
MSSACEWEISDSVIGAETQSRRFMARIGDGDTVNSERGEEQADAETEAEVDEESGN